MAEICVECLTKIINEKPRKRSYVLSKELYLCAVCGEQKRVVVRGRGIVFSIKCKIMARRLRKNTSKKTLKKHLQSWKRCVILLNGVLWNAKFLKKEEQ